MHFTGVPRAQANPSMDHFRYLKTIPAGVGWIMGPRLGSGVEGSTVLHHNYILSSPLPQLSDLHRVWLMRQGFLLLDFEDASADSLKSMLLLCTLQPLYLTSEEVGGCRECVGQSNLSSG